MKQNVNTLVAALIASGYIEEITGAPSQSPADYEFGLDNRADAKLIPGMLRTAYTAVLGAALRANAISHPIFDGEEEDNGMGPDQPEQPLTLEEAQHYASAVHRVALSFGHHEDSRWLVSMGKRELFKDEQGNDQVRTNTVHIVKTFKDWLTEQIETANKDIALNWYMSCIECRQLGVDVPLWADGVNEAMNVFAFWLAEVPWSREELTTTRKERAVAKTADNKWEAFKRNLLLNNKREIARVLQDWNLMVYSPKMAEDIAAIKANPVYVMHVATEQQAAQLAMLEKQELDLQFIKMRERFEATQKQIDERSKALAEAMGVKTEATKAQATVTPLARPNVINSR